MHSGQVQSADDVQLVGVKMDQPTVAAARLIGDDTCQHRVRWQEWLGVKIDQPNTWCGRQTLMRMMRLPNIHALYYYALQL